MKVQILIYGLAGSLMVGCASETASNFIPVEGGFGYAGHVSGFTDRSLTESFCYQDARGKTTTVWPYLQTVWGNNVVISNETVVLVGGVASLFTDGNERLKMRFIAFRGPVGPPMDITDQVLMKYYAGTGMGLTNWTGFNSLDKTNGSIQIAFGSAKIRPGTKNT